MLDGIIVGGGISGLALAHFLGLDRTPNSWELWEASDRLGGTIGTDRAEGFSVDWGPNGFLDREPLTLQLVREIGLTNSLEPAGESAEKRFIARHGRLHAVPLSPAKMLTTGLLSLPAKARVFCEPFIPARHDDGEESVFDFAARRIGRAAAETFVDPMVSGVFGGLAQQLSLPACFPIMREMELRYGSLVRAMISRQLEKRRARKASGAPSKGTSSGGPAGPGGRLTSFRGGLDLLVQRLGAQLQRVIKLNRSVCSIARQEGGWELTDEIGHRMLTKRVIVACPAYAAARFFRDYDRELSVSFQAIPYAPIVVVATGHRRADVSHPLDGFGFLVPRSEGVRTLGSIWTSSIFEGRAPDGCVQFRSMLGGAGDPGIMELSDDELWATLRKSLGGLIGIRNDPVFIRIYRWKRGIPQFTLGHLQRRARLERIAALHPGLYMVGNSYYGVSLNDCVKMAHRISQQISRGSALQEK
ncbi:MAG TPA: protoporphyrinogen oxidase [Acidobacteriota bacterium]|nr:protoporphyrinogen oxidase [Acidobacteriota bacterium]